MGCKEQGCGFLCVASVGCFSRVSEFTQNGEQLPVCREAKGRVVGSNDVTHSSIKITEKSSQNYSQVSNMFWLPMLIWQV